MTNVWFGTSWGAPICEDLPHVRTPHGETCPHCDEPIAADDSGMGVVHLEADANRLRYWHLECWMRTVIGSVGHQLGVCSCHGGEFEDNPAMTKRDAARAALNLFRETAAKRKTE